MHWLAGFAELNAQRPSPQQWNIIESKLGSIFNKVTPNRYTPPLLVTGLLGQFISTTC